MSITTLFILCMCLQAQGRDRAVPLSNSVSMCEESRIKYLQRKATQRGAESTEGPLPLTQGLDLHLIRELYLEP